MLTDVVAWLYGQAWIGACVAAFAWVPLAWRRWRSNDRPAASVDAYLWIATGIAGLLLGIIVGTAARVITAVLTGDGAIGRAPVALLSSLTLISLGSACLIWGSTIGRSPQAWRWFVTLTAVWAAGTLIWRL